MGIMMTQKRCRRSESSNDFRKRMAQLLVISAGLTLALLFLPSIAQAVPNVTWQAEPGMAAGARNAVAAEQVGGTIYVMGGININPPAGGVPLNTVEAYNPATQQWAGRNPVGVAKGIRGSAVVNNLVYVIGGYDGVNYLQSVGEFDPSTNSWRGRAQLNQCSGPVAAGDLVINNRIYAVGGIAAGAVALNSVEEYDPVANVWIPRQAMNVARGGAMAGVSNNRLYVFGGQGGGGFLNSVEEYDPATNTWQARAPMPTARSFGVARSYNNRIYVVGGETAAGSTGVIEVYNPATNTWTTCPNTMPTPRQRFGLAILGNRLYAVGGSNNNVVVNTNEEGLIINPTLTWTNEPALPLARNACDAQSLGGNIYLVGGINQNPPVGGAPIAVTAQYDTINRVWAPLANIPTARGVRGIAALGGQIYAYGGFNGNVFVNNVEAYNPATNTWQALAPMNQCAGPVAAADTVVNNRIYAIGGAVGGPNPLAPVATVEEYDPATNVWTPRAQMSLARTGAMAAVANNRIYVFGGQIAGGLIVNTVEEYDPATNTWRARAPMPTARAFGLARAYNNRIYTVGGITAGNVETAVVEVYNPATDSWAEETSMPTARGRFAMTIVGNYLHVMGGSTGAQVLNSHIRGEIESNTPTGNSVTVSPISSVILNFTTINGGGSTSAVQVAPPQGPPGNFTFLGNVFDVRTTANYVGVVTVVFSYNPAQVGNPNAIQLLHWNGNAWQNVTTSIDTVNNTVTGQVNSLSPFVLAYPLSSPGPSVSTGYNSYWLTIMAIGLLAAGLHFLRRKAVA